MAVGAFIEPLIVVTLLFGGAWFNRDKDYDFWKGKHGSEVDLHLKRSDVVEEREYSKDILSTAESWISGSSPTLGPSEQPVLRRRRLQFFGYEKIVLTPNTVVFKDRLLSRVLQKFPFLTEVYQLGRAFTAVTLVESTVHIARKHALQIIHLEQHVGIFYEVSFQNWFLDRPTLLQWINRVYSFIHIPGTILFLVFLFYVTTTRRRQISNGRIQDDFDTVGPTLYEARRRTMAMCNLLAFIVFTFWPCMPPRLLSDPEYDGIDAVEAESFGFVDTVHGEKGESSVWTTNKFCNQYAAMPSLHFGYSLLVGLTIATVPIMGLRRYSWKRVIIIIIGMSYPTLILTAIVATANHFILDAMAGAIICGIAWKSNGLLLNLFILEDYFLWMVRIHKPVNYADFRY